MDEISQRKSLEERVQRLEEHISGASQQGKTKQEIEALRQLLQQLDGALGAMQQQVSGILVGLNELDGSA